VKRELRFARAADGTRIAFATAGTGYPLVNAAHWLGHLEFDWQTPIWAPWLEALCSRYRLTRYDSRGCGLSDRGLVALSLEDLVSDLEAVVDAAGLERFALLGACQGGAISVAYAARHPERVSHLVLCGAFTRGEFRRDADPQRRETVAAMRKLIEVGWGVSNSAFLQLFTTLFFPSATPEQALAFNEIQRRAAHPAHAARLMGTLLDLDASRDLKEIGCPTLVCHSTEDAVIPFEEGRFTAASIHGARFQPLDSANHLPLAGEPAFEQLLEAFKGFLPGPAAVSTEFGQLSRRERDILDLMARGFDNAQVAARLMLAEKTVRNRVTQIYEKIGVESRAQAIVRARDGGFGL
jgi:pimeloyl-ACP methyl ester carboxylesterase